MSEPWAVVALVGAGTAALKAVGPAVLGGRSLPPRLDRMLQLLAPAVIAALVVTSAFDGDRALVIDHRVIGLVVAAGAVALRLPLTVVVLLAAVATAIARLLI